MLNVQGLRRVVDRCRLASTDLPLQQQFSSRSVASSSMRTCSSYSSFPRRHYGLPPSLSSSSSSWPSSLRFLIASPPPPGGSTSSEPGGKGRSFTPTTTTVYAQRRHYGDIERVDVPPPAFDISRASPASGPGVFDLPPHVASQCMVYRNVLTADEEFKLQNEVKHILERQGEHSYVVGKSAHNERVTRNTSADLHGLSEFTELQDWRTGRKRKFPGLIWSPTLFSWCQHVGKALLGVAPDTAFVVEHHLPGFEMHTERPAVGSQFLLLNILSPFVMRLDDESKGHVGHVLMPARSVARFSGELRWGWRYGEAFADNFDEPRPFRNRSVDLDVRMSIVLYKMTASLVDRRQLSDNIDSRLRAATNAAATGTTTTTAPSSSTDAAASTRGGEREHDDGALVPPDVDVRVKGEDSQSAWMGDSSSSGSGRTSADPTSASTLVNATPRSDDPRIHPPRPLDMQQAQEQLNGYRGDFSRLQALMKELDERSKGNHGGLTQEWVDGKIAQATGGRQINVNEPPSAESLAVAEEQWRNIEAKAQEFRSKISGMKSAFDHQQQQQRQTGPKAG